MASTCQRRCPVLRTGRPDTAGLHRQAGLSVGHCAPVRQILVEQQLPAGMLITRPSRSAVKALLEAHQMLKTRFGAQHERTIKAIRALGDFCDAWGKPTKAAEWRGKLAEEGIEP